MKICVRLLFLACLFFVFSACVGDGVSSSDISSSKALYSVEVGSSNCSKDSIELFNMSSEMYQGGRCDFASVYSRMSSECGARVKQAYRNMSYKQVDSLLFASLATMDVQKAITEIINKCDEFFIYGGGLYMFIERQDDGRGFK